MDSIIRYVSDYPVATGVFAILGALALSRFALSLLSFLWVNLLRPSKNLKVYGAKSGYWAVVTGASDGIGQAFAEQLARQGFNIVLISRTLSKLQTIAASIEEKSKVKTKVVAVDFTKPSAADWANIAASVKDVDVGVLVNNVGLSNEMPERFLETDSARVRGIVDVNIHATNEITRLVLPRLLENKKKGKRGLVINLSSAGSIMPTPLLSVYAGTKCYINSWSQALAAEYNSAGVDFDAQVPFFVVSNMSKRRHASLTTPTATGYAAAALKKVGFNDGVSSPYFVHAIFAYVISHLPVSFLVNQNKNLHEDIRKRALAKRERENKAR